MKRLILTAGLALAAVSGFSQGTIDFKNTAIVSGSPVVNAPVFQADGVTRAAGTSFRAALYAGTPGTAADQLRMIGAAVGFSTAPTGAGFFLGGTRTLNENGVTILPGASATLQVRAWAVASGSTWETATQRGQSDTFTVTSGGAGVPAGPPSLMVGLTSFSVVPEPSTIALGIIGGLGTLFLVRRRK
jgi:hypothetical protein